MTTPNNKGLENLPQTQPPDTVWNHIEKELDKEKKRRLPLWTWQGMGIAASIVLLAACWWVFLYPSGQEMDIAVIPAQQHREEKTPAAPRPVAEAETTANAPAAQQPVAITLDVAQMSPFYNLNLSHTPLSYSFTGATPYWSFGEGTITYSEQTFSTISPNEAITTVPPPEIHDENQTEWDDSEEPSSDESYAPLIENEYKDPFSEPLSTFSIDVDNASYSNTRRMLLEGELPPKDAVRIEEFINYFDYDYPQPKAEDPFSIYLETASCPWNKDTRVVMIGLQGKDADRQNLPASNLVFLIDVSGSMSSENKLPMVKGALKMLVNELGSNDRIAIVTYAGSAGLALPSTSCMEKETITKAIDQLEAGGSTAGGEGITLAYQVAATNLLKDGNNRIILVTDGDFNVGLSTDDEMKDLIEEKKNAGIFLTVCGFGMGNYKDSKMEILADKGNGNYYYIDNFKESKKVFVTDLTGTLFTIAKDVKIQVEFNPKFVKAYRLIGYENRLMPPQDFDDDTKDAGELGAGHTVTALYEIIPAGSKAIIPGFTELKYQEPPSRRKLRDYGNELLTVKLRYKKPQEETSRLLERTLGQNSIPYEGASHNLRLACGVATYGMLLRESKFKGSASYELATQLLKSAELSDINGYKEELLQLIGIAAEIE